MKIIKALLKIVFACYTNIVGCPAGLVELVPILNEFCESEINNFDFFYILLIVQMNQNILRFQISVDNARVVNIHKAEKQLLYHEIRFTFFEKVRERGFSSCLLPSRNSF